MATSRRNRRWKPVANGHVYTSVRFVIRTPKGDIPVSTKAFGQELIDLAPSQPWRLIQVLTYAHYKGRGESEPEQVREVDVTRWKP